LKKTLFFVRRTVAELVEAVGGRRIYFPLL